MTSFYMKSATALEDKMRKDLLQLSQIDHNLQYLNSKNLCRKAYKLY